MDKKIRLASDQDVANLLPLVSAYHHFERLNTSEPERESAVRRLLSNSEFGRIWLIFCDEKLSGYIVICRGFSIEFNGFDAFVDEFYLVPEIRGKGVGTWVLGVIKQKAKEFDVNALHLEVARNNSGARNLYVKAGFEAREKYVLMSLKIFD